MQYLHPGTLLQGGRYRIESLIGGGGFGNTYLATNIAFGDLVAIKEFFIKGVNEHDETQSVTISNSEHIGAFQEQKEKFKKEAHRLREFNNNPYIVHVHDLFEENNTVYYVMDFIDGESLAQRMKRTGQPLSEVEVRTILPQILSALQSVHNERLWHLDLKPGNIMVDSKGNIRLIDFGASKQMDRATGGATAMSRQQKTEGYAPPEQMEENFRKYGPWTDIYALGATLYVLLTNKRPPSSSDINDDTTPDKHIALPFPPYISQDMRQIVVWMMQVQPSRRPQRISEVIRFFPNSFTDHVYQGDEETHFVNHLVVDDHQYNERTYFLQGNIPPKPNDYLPLALISTLLCFPVGIVSLINTFNVNSFYRNEVYDAAQTASRNAKKWALLAILIWIILWLISFFVQILISETH